jgi:glycosyltransferase involved in cell wall biosynthesis
MRVWYLPLEPYVERYTWQLQKWTEKAFARNDILFTTVLGAGTQQHISTGRVLDAHGRCLWALSQMAQLVKHLQTGAVQADDVILLHDLFHPGYEALPYILAQQFKEMKPRVYAQNWAQSVDVYDFTFPMRGWMRPYEHMCDSTLSGVFVASTEHRNLLASVGLLARSHVIGLPFDMVDVCLGVPYQPWHGRKKRVVFSSRFDSEKQPKFFLELARQARTDSRFKEAFQDVEFAVCTGSKGLRSNDGNLVLAAKQFEQKGFVQIYEALSKPEYYEILADSRAHFNCSLQDWVSFSMLEASALGPPTLAPSFRGFPEALFADPRRLYTPWNMDEALRKLAAMLKDEPLSRDCRNVAEHHDGTLARMCDIIKSEAAS